METKICSKCKIEKSINEFCNNKKKKDNKNIWCKECQSEYYKQNSDKIKKQHKKYFKKNKNKIIECNKKYYEQNKEKFKEYASCFIKYSHSAIKELSIYDQVTENKEGFAVIQCAYCGYDVIPTILQVRSRIKACNSLNKGEHRIYCNNNNNTCKSACPSYRRRIYPLGFKIATSREVNPLLRQLCFKRDNYVCQHCGINIKSAQLHCHHIIGVTHSPIKQHDLSNVITLCKECHINLHKQKGCTNQDYSCKA